MESEDREALNVVYVVQFDDFIQIIAENCRKWLLEISTDELSFVNIVLY